MPRVRGFAMTAPVPANGSAIVALLVGGNDDILRSLRSDLYDEFGIEIRNHWENARQFCPMPPRGTEAVLVLTDVCSHTMSREAKTVAKAASARFVLIGRKKSAWLNALRKCGFVHKPSWRRKAPPPAVQERKEPKMTTEAPKNGTTVAPTWTPPVAPANPKPIAFAARIIDPPRRWTEQDMQTVIRLAEAWHPTNPPGSLLADAERFVDEIWKELGTYRTAAVLRLRIDALQAVITVRKDLLVGLSRAARVVRDAKRAYIEIESAQIKGPRSEWPPLLTIDAVLTLIGKRNRFHGKPRFDRVIGTLLYERADVLKVVDVLEARGLPPEANGMGMTPLEWETRILNVLKSKGPSARNAFHISSDDAHHRGNAALALLVKSGTILEGFYRGTPWYRLPEHAWPPPPRKMPPRAKKPAPAPLGGQFAAEFGRAVARASAALDRPLAPKPAPSADTIKEARADVYRAMRAGEITAKDAAEILRQLAGGQ